MTIFAFPAIDLGEIISGAFVLLMIILGMFGDRKKRSEAVRERIRKEKEQEDRQRALREGAAPASRRAQPAMSSQEANAASNSEAVEKKHTAEEILAAVFSVPYAQPDKDQSAATGAPEPGWFPPARPAAQAPQFGSTQAVSRTAPPIQFQIPPAQPASPRRAPQKPSQREMTPFVFKGLSAQLGDIKTELGDIDTKLGDVDVELGDIKLTAPETSRASTHQRGLTPVQRAIVLSEVLGPPHSLRRRSSGRSYLP